jgi:hypothetical protein
LEGALHPMSTPDTTLRGRAAAGFLLLLLVIGSLALWIGIPVATLWVLSKLTESSTYHFVFGLIGVPLAMALFAPFLIWVNALYLRVTGEYTSEEDEDPPRRLHGPLEPILIACFVVALVALFVWFFAVAENPPRQVI